VAITDGIGGEAICKRIRKQLESSERLQQAGVTHATSYRLLEAAKRSATESKEDLLETVAAEIQDLMNQEISSKQAKK
jgi:dihydroneopterin aldolase